MGRHKPRHSWSRRHSPGCPGGEKGSNGNIGGICRLSSTMDAVFGLWAPLPGDGSSMQEADPAVCEKGKQLKSLTIKSWSVFRQTLVGR